MTNPWYYFQSGYRRIKRFIAWFPIIWRDEDWDSAYLFEIMRFKISRIRKEIDTNKRHVGYQKHVRQMKVVEELLSRIAYNRVYSDFYWDLSQRLRDLEKQGKCACPEKTYCFKPSTYDQAGKLLTSELVDLSCDYCKAARRRWFKEEDAKQNADFEYLFRHLQKHVKGWWD